VTPLKLLPRFRELDRALGRLAEREPWPRQRIEAFQLDRLNQLWAHAVGHVPYYRQLAADHRLPGSFGSLDAFSASVPLLEKDAVRDTPQRFLSDAAEPGRWHRTGGSTGTPMNIYKSHAAHRADLRNKYRAESARGLGVFDRKVFLWGHGASLAKGLRGQVARWRRPIEDRLRGRQRLSAYQLGPNDLAGYLDRIRRFRPVGLYGYSSAVGLLAQEALRRGVRCPSLRLITLSAEPAHPWILDEIRAAFDAEVMIEYGSVECGVMATQDRDGRLRIREDHLLIETRPRDDNGRHELLVTVLHNPCFPLIRYRIGDLTSAPIQRPEQGFACLKDVAGRDNDMLWSAEGRAVHSLAVKHVVEHHPRVRRFCARQREDGHLTLQLETDAELPTREIAEQLSGLLAGLPVTVEGTPRLQGNAAGKHRWVISDMRPPARARPAAETDPAP